MIGSCGSFVILIGSCSASGGDCGFCLFHLASAPFFQPRHVLGTFFFLVVPHLSYGFLKFSEFLELPEFPGSPFFFYGIFFVKINILCIC